MKKLVDADHSGHLLHSGSQAYGKSKTFLKKKNRFKEVDYVNITHWKKNKNKNLSPLIVQLNQKQAYSHSSSWPLSLSKGTLHVPPEPLWFPPGSQPVAINSPCSASTVT